VRRGVSISVLLLLLSSVLVPLAQAGTAPAPLCCRVGGQHHCNGMPGGDGFHSLPGKCPYRVAPAVTSGVVALAPVVLPHSFLVAERHTVELQESASIRVALDTTQERGPPLL